MVSVPQKRTVHTLRDSNPISGAASRKIGRRIKAVAALRSETRKLRVMCIARLEQLYVSSRFAKSERHRRVCAHGCNSCVSRTAPAGIADLCSAARCSGAGMPEFHLKSSRLRLASCVNRCSESQDCGSDGMHGTACQENSGAS